MYTRINNVQKFLSQKNRLYNNSISKSKSLSFFLFKSIPAPARKSVEMRGKSLLVEIAIRKGIESRWQKRDKVWTGKRRAQETETENSLSPMRLSLSGIMMLKRKKFIVEQANVSSFHFLREKERERERLGNECVFVEPSASLLQNFLLRPGRSNITARPWRCLLRLNDIARK